MSDDHKCALEDTEDNKSELFIFFIISMALPQLSPEC